MRIARAGYPFVLGCLTAAVAVNFLAANLHNVALGMLAGIAYLGAGFCAYFFRDPKRTIPQGDHLILSPADGKIMEIVEGKDPVFTEPVWVMRIFLSVFDPHIQRMPVSGTVQAIRYKTGCFLDARNPQACVENEQNRLEVTQRPSAPLSLNPSPRVDAGRGEGEGKNATSPQAGNRIVVTQIAGLIARRIVCWVKEGQSLAAGEQFGLIRFGSQVDVVMPKSVRLKVRAGDRVVAGASVIAELAQ